MLWDVIVFGLATTILFRSLWSVLGLPGDAQSPVPNDDSDLPWTVQSLVAEAGPLRDDLVSIFQTAVDYQLKGDNESALREYDKLRNIALEDGGTFDLASVSRVFRHNLTLLRFAMAHSAGSRSNPGVAND